MSRFTNNPAIFDQAIGLSEKQKQDPVAVIKGFFAEYPLSEVREIQDQIQRVCLTAEKGAFGRPEGRTKLLDCLEHMICLFEAALHLSQAVSPVVTNAKAEIQPKDSNPTRRLDPRIADIVMGINGVLVDVAHLCVVIVNAWGDKMRADLKLPPAIFKKGAQPSPAAYVDLNALQSMALTLQNKLASLSGLAIDLIISETKNHLSGSPS